MKIIAAFITVTITICSFRPAMAQIDSTLLKSSTAAKDTLKHTLNMDAIYNRPFLQLGKSPISIGGYVESNWQYVSTSGISVGNQFQFRRFSLFVASTITSHIKFLSEIEYEDDPTGDRICGAGLRIPSPDQPAGRDDRQPHRGIQSKP
jgi:hypothetical protein